MIYEEFIKTIVEADTSDWLYDDAYGTYVYKNNISITMKQDRDDDENFEEDWVENFSHHPKATRLMVYLCYNGNTGMINNESKKEFRDT